MKSFVLMFLLSMSAGAAAECITLAEAKEIAKAELKRYSEKDSTYDYSAWESEVENLEQVSSNGKTVFSYAWSVSNWENVRVTVDCSGAVDLSFSYTED